MDPGAASSGGLFRDPVISIDPPRKPWRQIVVHGSPRLALPETAPGLRVHTLSRGDQCRVFDPCRLEDTVKGAQMETEDLRHGLRGVEGNLVESLLGFL